MRHIEQSGHNFPDLAGFTGALIQKLTKPGTAPTLSRCTYTLIERVCDQALASDRAIEVQAKDQRVKSAFDKLSQYGPFPVITASILVGLAREGNLEVGEEDILKDISYTLSVIDDKRYHPFCAAIGRSIQTATIMAELSRPDYASIRQLAVIAEDSHEALISIKENQGGKFVAYTTLTGKRITSRKKFVSSLSGSGETVAGASIKMAVDLGVLATQPEKVPLEEKEWLRQNVHYVTMPGSLGSHRLKTALENFNTLLGIV